MKKVELHQRVYFFEHGKVDINRDCAREILGEPHYVEMDSTRTAGGEEDHWIYQYEDGVYVFFNLRVPYKHLSLYFSVKEKFDLKGKLPNKLLGFEIEEYEKSYALL